MPHIGRLQEGAGVFENIYLKIKGMAVLNNSPVVRNRRVTASLSYTNIGFLKPVIFFGNFMSDKIN
jgi:hypothetical protein